MAAGVKALRTNGKMNHFFPFFIIYFSTFPPKPQGFRDLQSAFKSFLELACHCVVLDLFDEELFEAIAFDPEQWLTNLMQDPDFKVCRERVKS